MAGYGIAMLVEAKEAAGSMSIALPAFMTALGLLLFVIGFLGCFGACYKNTCMLKTVMLITLIFTCSFLVCSDCWNTSCL